MSKITKADLDKLRTELKDYIDTQLKMRDVTDKLNRLQASFSKSSSGKYRVQSRAGEATKTIDSFLEVGRSITQSTAGLRDAVYAAEKEPGVRDVFLAGLFESISKELNGLCEVDESRVREAFGGFVGLEPSPFGVLSGIHNSSPSVGVARGSSQPTEGEAREGRGSDG